MGGRLGGNWGVEWGGRVWGAPPGGGRGASGSVWVDPLLCVLLGRGGFSAVIGGCLMMHSDIRWCVCV